MRFYPAILFYLLILATMQPACTTKDSMRGVGTASIDGGNGKGFGGETEDPPPSDSKTLVRIGNAKIRCETLQSSFVCKIYVVTDSGLETLATGFAPGVTVSFTLSGLETIISNALSCSQQNAGLSYVCTFNEGVLSPNVQIGVRLEVRDERSSQTEQSSTVAALSRAHDTWRTMSPVPAAFATSGAKLNAHAVWTGSQMIIWGGFYGPDGGNADGASYDPVTDSWKAISNTSAPSTRRFHGMVWTGKVVVVWGGAYGYIAADGGMYDPVQDAWTPTSMVNSPVGVYGNAFVWTGSKILTYGGVCMSCGPGGTTVALNTGAKFDPELNEWSTMSNAGAPAPVVYREMPHQAAYVGGKMFVFGGDTQGLADSGLYDPALDQWSAASTLNKPNGDSSTVVIGNKVFAFGGMGGPAGWVAINTGAIYDPAKDEWEVLPTTNAPSPRVMPSLVYTGTKVIVYGGALGYSVGAGYDTTFNDGGIYDLQTKKWSPLASVNAPVKRVQHTAVWTGAEMLIFGGSQAVSESVNTLNNGAAYYP